MLTLKTLFSIDTFLCQKHSKLLNWSTELHLCSKTATKLHTDFKKNSVQQIKICSMPQLSKYRTDSEIIFSFGREHCASRALSHNSTRNGHGKASNSLYNRPFTKPLTKTTTDQSHVRNHKYAGEISTETKIQSGVSSVLQSQPSATRCKMYIYTMVAN